MPLDILKNIDRKWLCRCNKFDYIAAYSDPDNKKAYVTIDYKRFYGDIKSQPKELIQFQFTQTEYDAGILGPYTCPQCARIYARVVANPNYKK